MDASPEISPACEQFRSSFARRWVTLLSSIFDLHDFRASSVLEFNPVAHVCGQQRLADWRNPTDRIPFKIEFVDADSSKGLGRAFFVLDRYRCAERDAIRRRVRRIHNLARCENLL